MPTGLNKADAQFDYCSSPECFLMNLWPCLLHGIRESLSAAYTRAIHNCQWRIRHDQRFGTAIHLIMAVSYDRHYRSPAMGLRLSRRDQAWPSQSLKPMENRAQERLAGFGVSPT